MYRMAALVRNCKNKRTNKPLAQAATIALKQIGRLLFWKSRFSSGDI